MVNLGEGVQAAAVEARGEGAEDVLVGDIATAEVDEGGEEEWALQKKEYNDRNSWHWTPSLKDKMLEHMRSSIVFPHLGGHAHVYLHQRGLCLGHRQLQACPAERNMHWINTRYWKKRKFLRCLAVTKENFKDSQGLRDDRKRFTRAR